MKIQNLLMDNILDKLITVSLNNNVEITGFIFLKFIK